MSERVALPSELTWTELAVMAADVNGVGGEERLRLRLVEHFAPLEAEVLRLRKQVVA